MKLYESKKNCCGCSACASVCPKEAVKMKRDEKGFLYPDIDTANCVECGLCVSVCDFKKEVNESLGVKQSYCLVHNDKNVLKTSSSGGAFTALSNIILDKNGVIFGCVLDTKTFDVYHTEAWTKDERDQMKGSKYVQSDMRNVFKQIKKYLAEDKIVMFTGTPCQVSGLYAFLGERPETLLTVDIICHGTPSVLFLKEHINFLEKKYTKKAAGYLFRDKKYGWRHVESVIWENGKKTFSYDTCRAKTLFLSNLGLRLSCYNCKYACMKREADISIGDCWGVEQVVEIYNNTGVSLLVTNSEKGENTVSKIKNCTIKYIDVNKVMQRALCKPAKKSPEVDTFWDYYFKHGYKALTNRYKVSKYNHYLRFGIVSLLVGLHLDKPVTFLKAKIRKK